MGGSVGHRDGDVAAGRGFNAGPEKIEEIDASRDMGGGGEGQGAGEEVTDEVVRVIEEQAVGQEV